MTEYDYTVTASDLLDIASQHGLDDPQEIEQPSGGVGLRHTSEVRPDVLTFDLAERIYHQQNHPDEKRMSKFVASELRQIVADLEVRTSHLAGTQTFVTYWRNVGLRPEG